MRFTSPLRLPLQTGGTALTTVLFTFILIPFYWGLWPILVLFLMGRDASRRRASDIVLSSDGREVRGIRVNEDSFTIQVRDANGKLVISPTQAVETYWFDVVNDTPTVAGLQAVLDRLLALPKDAVPASDREFWTKMKAAAPPVPVRIEDGKSIAGILLAKRRLAGTSPGDTP